MRGLCPTGSEITTFETRFLSLSEDRMVRFAKGLGSTEMQRRQVILEQRM